ncbi:MAG TPA: hypothetical protein VFM14_02070 [Gemmatimonadales bacterium]|nr:hypothetical protein [Gemmatimonadales bacterium]
MDQLSDSANTRQVALGQFDVSKRRHQSLLILPDGRRFTPEARDGASVLISIESAAGAGCSVLGFTMDGELAADLWFETIAAAKAELAAEFRIAEGSWVDVPPDEPDAQSFAVRHFGRGAREA